LFYWALLPWKTYNYNIRFFLNAHYYTYNQLNIFTQRRLNCIWWLLGLNGSHTSKYMPNNSNYDFPSMMRLGSPTHSLRRSSSYYSFIFLTLHGSPLMVFLVFLVFFFFFFFFLSLIQGCYCYIFYVTLITCGHFL
jgi:hypothetical protein